MSAPETMIEVKAAQLNSLLQSLPETQQQEIRDIFSWFATETNELYSLINTAAMAFESLQLAEGDGLRHVLFMATNHAYDVHAALKSVADDKGADDE
ncbi:MAG: hypothetical protein R3F02_06900 [Thiolinea sp.]